MISNSTMNKRNIYNEDLKIPHLPAAMALVVTPSLRESMVKSLGEETVQTMEAVPPQSFVIMLMERLFPDQEVLVALVEEEDSHADAIAAAKIGIITSLEPREVAGLALNVMKKALEVES